MATKTSKVTYTEGAAAATPAANEVATYAKADGKMYSKDDAGAETLMSAGTPATRASLGLDTTDSPQFAALNVGAATDTTLARVSAGVLSVEGNTILTDTGVVTYLDGTVAAAPATPAAGKLRLYAKTGKVLAVKDDTGAETVLGAGGSGAPTTAPYVTTAADGGLSAEVVIPGLGGSPDRLPASPNAADAEFDTQTLGTVYGTLDTDNVSDFASHWHAKRAHAGAFVSGRFQAAPSMPFTATAKLNASNVNFGANYNMAGILITEASPGKACTFGLVANGGVVYAVLYRWTNPTTFATNIDVNTGLSIWAALPRYLRLLVTSSTSVSASISHDGKIFYPLVGLQAVTPSLTVANVGLAIGDPAAAGTVEAVYDWLRIT